jgi:hypothetical protein
MALFLDVYQPIQDALHCSHDGVSCQPGNAARHEFHIESTIGRTILVGCWDGLARLYRLPAEVPDDVKRVAADVELATGLEFEDPGAVRVLTNREWLDRRERRESLAGRPRAPARGEREAP